MTFATPQVATLFPGLVIHPFSIGAKPSKQNEVRRLCRNTGGGRRRQHTPRSRAQKAYPSELPRSSAPSPPILAQSVSRTGGASLQGAG